MFCARSHQKKKKNNKVVFMYFLLKFFLCTKYKCIEFISVNWEKLRYDWGFFFTWESFSFFHVPFVSLIMFVRLTVVSSLGLSVCLDSGCLLKICVKVRQKDRCGQFDVRFADWDKVYMRIILELLWGKVIPLNFTWTGSW